MRVSTVTGMGVSVMLAFLTSAIASASAQQSSAECNQSVVLVHDMGSNAAAMRSLSDALDEAGRCTFLFEYGRNGVSAMLGSIGGLTEIESSAAEFATFLDSMAGGEGAQVVDVVAHGAGSLVVQTYLQRSPKANGIRSLTSIGPMWNGTDIAGLGTIESLSRHFGTYDAILAAEAPIVDPVCAGCRQIVAGSDFLTTLRNGGLVSPGVHYVNIVSDGDLFVVPSLSADVAGMALVRLSQLHPSSSANHFELLDDAVVTSTVAAVLNGQTQ
ncbi:lipase [Rhodococcus erythropolis]|uniref:esterase/lipase family protein n=1 Tax=Rhodococcus erythropolis TaxID=1833 RepID=UPI001E353A75|nr:MULTISPECIES: lipase [Rhodococcus erythropolis group]MCD2107907.1 lipase [Rhodococcus qingshengii]MCZ4527078.1 lipase [Rhodococcus erythropolis]